jgi:TonB family protein
MMKNIISSPYRKMKILFILPVFAIVLYAFAKPDYKYNYADENSGDKMASVSLLQHEVKGKVVDQDANPLPGTSVTVRGTTQGISTDAKGSFKLDNIPEDGILIFSFVGYKTKVLKPVFTSEMTVSMTKDTVKYMNLNISTPPPPPPPPPPMNSTNDSSNVAPPPPPPAELGNRSEDGKKPLVFIDGKISDMDVEKIDPGTIESVEVFKDKSAIDKYGEKGKDGVIEIKTKGKADNKDAWVVAEEMPRFPGGTDAMVAWIISNLKYPAEAVKAKITGKVYVSFMVSKAGKVKNVVVSKSASQLLNAEAIRVISSMPDWKPGSQAGKLVDVQMQVPVEFKLK